MGFGSLWHWIIVLLIVLVLFGRGRISEMMGDFGRGISSFKKGMSETEELAASARIEPPVTAPAPVETPQTPAQTTPADKTDTTGA
jgi:sec-independent protein translocase protein TatA